MSKKMKPAQDESAARPVILTVQVEPLKNGKRRIVVTGAPQDEMPVVKIGLFADLHRLLDETWAALLQRKPQVVKKPKEREAKGVQRGAESEAAEGDAAPAGESATPESRPEEEMPADAKSGEDLPEIENDDAGGEATDDQLELLDEEA